jgi:hypothetical protein
MAQPTPSQSATPRGKMPSASKDTELDEVRNGEAVEQEEIPGQDVREARGLSRAAGSSPNEAGTDQRVEDAKRERSGKR